MELKKGTKAQSDKDKRKNKNCSGVSLRGVPTGRDDEAISYMTVKAGRTE
ncbi:hypothetical protein IIC38_17195 [candidate division KSB1 bacterium]|nr:hypothetical protein [candidate division KSB1 bacterium]